MQLGQEKAGRCSISPLAGEEGGGGAEYPRPLLFLSREMFVYPKARGIEEEEESLLVESSTDVF